MWQSPARDLGNSQQLLNKGAWKAPKALEAGCTVQEWNHYVFVCLYFYSLSRITGQCQGGNAKQCDLAWCRQVGKLNHSEAMIF